MKLNRKFSPQQHSNEHVSTTNRSECRSVELKSFLMSRECNNYVRTSNSWYLPPFFTERWVICTILSEKHTDNCRLENSIDLDWVVETEENWGEDSFWLPSHHISPFFLVDIKDKPWKCCLFKANQPLLKDEPQLMCNITWHIGW